MKNEATGYFKPSLMKNNSVVLSCRGKKSSVVRVKRTKSYNVVFNFRDRILHILLSKLSGICHIESFTSLSLNHILIPILTNKFCRLYELNA